MGHDDVDVHPDQLGCEARKTLEFPIRKTPLNGQILSLDVTELAYSLDKRIVVNVGTRWRRA